jgi:hypothetical protein
MTTPGRSELLAFMRQERYGVQASISPEGRPQAAVVGVAVSDRFEVIFDTISSTRKAINLRSNPAIAMVLGSTDGDAQKSVQLEGVADEPGGDELTRLLELYFAQFPDGRVRQQWPGITWFRVMPTWLRFSDYSADPPRIVTLSAQDLERLV